MAIELKMPALSPTMEEGTLAKWLKSEGDEIVAGDIIAEIETDKATMEFEAVDEGTLGKILIEEGTEGVKVGTVIAMLAGEGEDASDIEAPADSGTVEDVPGEGKDVGRPESDATSEPAMRAAAAPAIPASAPLGERLDPLQGGGHAPVQLAGERLLSSEHLVGEESGDEGQPVRDLPALGEERAAGGGRLEVEDPDGGVLGDAVREPAAGLELHHTAGRGPQERPTLVDVQCPRALGGATAEGEDLPGLAAPLGGVADLGDDLPDPGRRGVDLDGALDGACCGGFGGH